MADEPKPTPPATPPRVQLKVSDELAQGRYANFVVVHNNDIEFIVDFVFMEPQQPRGQVVSRVIANPRTAKRLLVGLQELVRRYEERFGVIPVPESGGGPQSSYH